MEKAPESEHDDTSDSNNSLEEDMDQLQEEEQLEPEGSRVESGNNNDEAEMPTQSEDENQREHEQQARRRELNRLSKARCRKRRNDLIKNLEEEISRLSSEHNSLRAENEQLRQEYLECVSGGLMGQVNANHDMNAVGLMFQNPIASTNLFPPFLQGAFPFAPQQNLFLNQLASVGQVGQAAGVFPADTEFSSDHQPDTDAPPNRDPSGGL